MMILAPLLAGGFALRFAGATIHLHRGVDGQPWGTRVASWLSFGAAVALLGLAGSTFAVAAFGAFLVLDGASGVKTRDVGTPPTRRKRDWKPLLWSLAGAAYLGATAAFYFLVGRYVTHGILVTWAILAFGFSLALLLWLRGRKAPEGWLLPPPDHRVHERRETTVLDPQRKRAEDVLQTFRTRGDAGPFLDMVREAATQADLPATDVDALEKRILASFARAGTRRDEDVASALAEVERILTLKTKPMETSR